MVKKITLIITTVIILLFISIIITNGINLNNIKTKTNNISNIDPTSNYFGQKEDTTKVEIIDTLSANQSYEKVASNQSLELYLNKKTCGIAVKDKRNDYIWYSSYNNIDTLKPTDAVKAYVESGVTITVYDTSTLNEVTKYCSIEKDCSITYQNITNGFKASFNFITLAVKFDIEVTIDNNDLNTKVLFDTLVEEKYQTKAMKVAKEYKLKDIELFPFMGSDNYNINAYAFIPDGNGALIKYTDIPYDTAYIKQVYGTDSGTIQKTTSEYLKNNYDVTLPIYGINHGYHQAAFLCQITSGMGSTELHSYPYMYSNLGLNRTFFKFLARNKINIDMQSSDSGIITIINNNVVNDTYELKYSFLDNDNASYSGMAKEYQSDLNLTKNNNSNNNIKLKLDTLGQDYKKGLFGKNYVEMTTYNNLLNIVQDLTNNNVNNLSINYIGYNQNGYFDNTLSKIKLDNNLGTKKEYHNLINYLKDHNYEIYYYSNPIIATKNLLVKETIKTLNLKLFEYTFKSSLEQTGRYINPLKLSTYFLSNTRNYNKLKMTNFSFSTLGNTCISYRYQSNEFTRDEYIEQITSELNKIKQANTDYKIALENPYSYLYQYINSIYNTPVESGKYAFITDSIPFISLLLTGYIDLYSSNINYVSNYDLYYLRLIEYHLYPSFIITYEDTNKLRYCNYEYLYTTKYDDWKDQIINSYNTVNNGLKDTINSNMISHRYIDTGLCECIYSNGYKIYINYNNTDYYINSTTCVPSMGYLVIK